MNEESVTNTVMGGPRKNFKRGSEKPVPRIQGFEKTEPKNKWSKNRIESSNESRYYILFRKEEK